MLISKCDTAAGAMKVYVLPRRSMVSSEPRLLLRAMSAPLVLLPLESVLMFIVHVTTRGHVNHTFEI